MELSIKSTTLLIAILLTGLSAGLFYAWEVSVIPGTKRIPDRAYLETMQSINRAILNPAFYLIFFGSLLFLIGSSYLQYKTQFNLAFGLILAATLSYVIGTFGVTLFGNVPLNEGLDIVNLNQLSKEALTNTRLTYEGQWNRWHTIRTIFSVLAFLLCLLAAFMESSSDKISSLNL